MDDVRRLLAVILLTAAVLVAPSASTVAAQEDETTTTSIPESGHIIPEPNSGVAPTDAGDRGGALQTVVFAVVIAGVGAIGMLVVRESRKARSARGY